MHFTAIKHKVSLYYFLNAIEQDCYIEFDELYKLYKTKYMSVNHVINEFDFIKQVSVITKDANLYHYKATAQPDELGGVWLETVDTPLRSELQLQQLYYEYLEKEEPLYLCLRSEDYDLHSKREQFMQFLYSGYAETGEEMIAMFTDAFANSLEENLSRIFEKYGTLSDK